MRTKNSKKKKKKESMIEAELFALLEKSLKQTLNMALDNVLKGFK